MPTLTPPEAAEKLRKLMYRAQPYHRSFIYKLIKENKIPHKTSDNGDVLIEESDLIAYAKAKREQSKSDKRIGRHYSDY